MIKFHKMIKYIEMLMIKYPSHPEKMCIIQ